MIPDTIFWCNFYICIISGKHPILSGSNTSLISFHNLEICFITLNFVFAVLLRNKTIITLYIPLFIRLYTHSYFYKWDGFCILSTLFRSANYGIKQGLINHTRFYTKLNIFLLSSFFFQLQFSVFSYFPFHLPPIP